MTANSIKTDKEADALSEEPLSPLDANFWSIETPTTRQTVAALCLLKGHPDPARLREALEATIVKFPLLKKKIAEGRNATWTGVENFSLEQHLEYRFEDATSDEQLIALASESFQNGVARDQALWKLLIICAKDNPARAVALFMVHHAMADGLAGMDLFDHFCSRAADEPSRAVLSLSKKARKASEKSKLLDSSFSVWSSILRLLRDGLRKSVQSPFTGKNSSRRLLKQFSLPFEQVAAVRKHFDVSVNDLMLALVSYTARRYHIRHSAPLGDLRIIMPVNLRSRENKEALGNHLTGVGVRLPLALNTLEEHIATVARRTKRIRERGSFGAYALLAHLNARLPDCIRRRMSESAARRTHLICSSMTASKSVKFLGGVEIESNSGVPALMRNQGLAFGFTRYAGSICVALDLDPAIVSDVESITTTFQDNWKSILESVSRESTPSGRQHQSSSG